MEAIPSAALRRSASRSRVRTWLLIALLAAGVTLAGLAAWLFYGSRSAPSWWRQAGVLPPDPAEHAAATERGAATLLHAARPPDEVWSVALHQEDANAWLKHRLPSWLANRGLAAPDFEPRVSFDDGLLRIGLGMEPKRVMWMALDVSFEPAPAGAPGDAGARPALRLAMRGSGVGRVPVPAVFVERVGMPVLHRATGGWLASDGPRAWRLTVPPIDLSDGRRVRVLGVAVEPGAVRFQLRTDR
jgi:hypothetical protein